MIWRSKPFEGMDNRSLLRAFEAERVVYLEALSSLQRQLDACKEREATLRSHVTLLHRGHPSPPAARLETSPNKRVAIALPNLSATPVEEKQLRYRLASYEHLVHSMHATTSAPNSAREVDESRLDRDSVYVSPTPAAAAHQHPSPIPRGRYVRGSSPGMVRRAPSSSARKRSPSPAISMRSLSARLEAAEAAAASASRARDEAVELLGAVTAEAKAQQVVLQRLIMERRAGSAHAGEAAPSNASPQRGSLPSSAVQTQTETPSPPVPQQTQTLAPVAPPQPHGGPSPAALSAELEAVRRERDDLALALARARIVQSEGTALMAEMVAHMAALDTSDGQRHGGDAAPGEAHRDGPLYAAAPAHASGERSAPLRVTAFGTGKLPQALGPQGAAAAAYRSPPTAHDAHRPVPAPRPTGGDGVRTFSSVGIPAEIAQQMLLQRQQMMQQQQQQAQVQPHAQADNGVGRTSTIGTLGPLMHPHSDSHPRHQANGGGGVRSFSSVPLPAHLVEGMRQVAAGGPVSGGYGGGAVGGSSGSSAQSAGPNIGGGSGDSPATPVVGSPYPGTFPRPQLPSYLARLGVTGNLQLGRASSESATPTVGGSPPSVPGMRAGRPIDASPIRTFGM